MKLLVIGLGSMGKRRIRNLQEIGGHEISGFDLREDRVNEVGSLGIKGFHTFDAALSEGSPDALIISTSPDQHMEYATWALDHKINAFVEASVTHRGKIQALGEALEMNPELVIVPSCTMRFFPGPKIIRDILERQQIGRIYYINYCTGQYLPDWHPWEDIEEYYVSKRETGAAREIVPFELTWINELFGLPNVINSFKAKLSDLKVDIDDFYQSTLRYPGGEVLNMVVEVLSQPVAMREMTLVGEKGIINLSHDFKQINLHISSLKNSKTFPLQAGTIESGYINPEEPYIEEMSHFLAACENADPSLFPNSMASDSSVLEILEVLEEKAVTSK